MPIAERKRSDWRGLRGSWLLIALVFLFSANAVFAADGSDIAPRKEYSEIVAILRPFIEGQLAEKRIPGLSIALVDDRQIVWAQGFGLADAKREKPATAETVYRIGSVSKLFTDIAIMQLVERGELNLDAPISEYLPDFHPHNPFGAPITLRELMSHRSGLLREPPVGNYFDPSELSLGAMVQSLNGTTLVYAPGTRTKYSNAGVAVAGYVLEKQSGQPFAMYLRQAVLDPMGLRNSAFQPQPEL